MNKGMNEFLKWCVEILPIVQADAEGKYYLTAITKPEDTP